MVKPRNKKNGLSQSLDNKISDLIYRMLEEKSLEKQRFNAKKREALDKAIEDSDESSMEDLENELSDIFLARDLKFPEVIGFCQSKDLSLQRVKKVLLEKTIEKVLGEIIKEEIEELATIIPADTESSEKDLAEKNLMVSAESNDMNKIITSQWQVSKSESTETEDSKKLAKKRAKDDSKEKTKRQKKDDRAPPNSNLSMLGGMDDVIAQLMELIGLPILHPEIYAATGVEPPRGVLLHGPPGCGKTSIANALAGELQVPFISISAPSVVSGMSGESEKKIRELFEEARS